MSSYTDFFVAISGDSARAAPFGSNCRFHSHDEQGLIKDVISQSAESILLLAFVEDKSVGKALCKAMFSFFAESINPNKDVYTQFKVSFVEEKANDLIQYRCERLGDIDAVVEAEDGAHNCSSICATNVVPKESSFLFVEQRLTVMLCTAAEYTADKLVRMSENMAIMIGCRVASVGFYIPKEAMCSHISLDALAEEGHRFKEMMTRRAVGREERVSSRVRLQDVRAWSLMVNERNHFSPIEPGPYFISLNPQLIVGEKLAHYIHEERTYIVGEGTNASPVDFCVMPPVADGDALHRSVYSPHCRMRREGYAVYLKPECGMTYLNGKLIAEEQLLQHNDRIILGKQLAFRFVMVGTEVPKNPDSRILDWELCAKEFRRENERAVENGTIAAQAQTIEELRARCDGLEAQLANARGDTWLVMTNPPTGYKGLTLWPLDLRKRHSKVTIGPQGDVALPFLTSTASLKHSSEGLVFRSGSSHVPISNGSRVVLGAFTFAVSIDESIAPGRSHADTVVDGASASEDAVREMQASIFSLQWSIGALFDYVFPVKGRKVKREDDNYYAYRAPLYDTHVFEAATVHTTDVAALNAQLTAAVRLMGAGLAKEMREMGVTALQASTVATPRSAEAALTPRGGGSDPHHNQFAKAEDFLQAFYAAPSLSAAVLRQVNTDIGTILLETCNGHAPATTGASPKTARGVSKDRLRDVAPPSMTASSAAAATEAKLLQLRGTCFLASPTVVRRASTTVDLLSFSTNAKAMWERHVQHVTLIGKSFSEKKGDDANLLGELLLLIVDAVLSTDYCLRRRLLSPGEVEGLDPQLVLWQEWAEKCVNAMDTQATTARGTWKHEAAVQRKATPHVQRSSAKKRSDATALNGSTNGLTINGNGSRKASLSRTTTLGQTTTAPPRIMGDLSSGRAALATTYTGKTPHNLSSFATLRRASFSSTNGATLSARGPRSSQRRSSSSTGAEKTKSTVKKRSSSVSSRGTAAGSADSGRKKADGSARKTKKKSESPNK